MRTAVIFFCCLLSASDFITAEEFRFPVEQINHTLNYIAIDTSDVSFRTDYVDRDSFRLSIVDYFTIHPLEIPRYLKSRGDFLRDTTITIQEKFDSLVWTLNNSWSPVNPQAIRPLTGLVSPSISAIIGQVGPVLGNAGTLWDRISSLALTMAAAIGYSEGKPASAERSLFVRQHFAEFLREEEKDIDRPLDELDSLEKLHDSLAVQFKAIGPKIDFQSILVTSATVVDAYERLSQWLQANSRMLESFTDEEIRQLPHELTLYFGKIAVGGRGSDHYEGAYAIIVDLGGDDEYDLENEDSLAYQVIIDIGGNDQYIARSDCVFGASFMGCGILDDWGGDDIYLAKNFSLGCGLFGTGILIDRGGNDLYQGDNGCQGASSFGVGMLIDYSGRDTYIASIYSQGFAFIMGSSALVDIKGNDNYTLGWKYGDILRYEDHYLSLGQGFAYGLRPHFSGGVGLLVDGAGNDSYNADIFGQGASYWFSLGGLIDYEGSDRYVAHQYAQGAATHLCLASLIDITGDDVYTGKGLMQGCGHDLAYALLLDCSGNDQYQAHDLSQAAGSANGIGMLVDLKGDDAYLVRVKENTHGYGNPRRDYGSIGLQLDLDGKDAYSGEGADSSYWITSSKWGIGADLSTEKKDAE